MNITTTIKHVRGKLLLTFSIIDSWFDSDEELLHFRPGDNRWTIAQILEHISLTNHYLLILIGKAASKAVATKEKQSLADALSKYVFRRNELNIVSMHGSFEWMRPEHMEPSGTVSLIAVRKTVKQQVNECLTILETLSDGAGILYKTTMTVNNLGKLDVYEYIYFLAMHGMRHIHQMEQNATAFLVL